MRTYLSPVPVELLLCGSSFVHRTFRGYPQFRGNIKTSHPSVVDIDALNIRKTVTKMNVNEAYCVENLFTQEADAK